VITARQGVLGSYTNRWFTTAAGAVASALLVSLNAVLLVLLLTGAE
jgi:manganese transport protein